LATREMPHGSRRAVKTIDFPVHAEPTNNDGKAIAKARTKTAEDLAERLNAEEDRREEDRWSA